MNYTGFKYQLNDEIKSCVNNFLKQKSENYEFSLSDMEYLENILIPTRTYSWFDLDGDIKFTKETAKYFGKILKTVMNSNSRLGIKLKDDNMLFVLEGLSGATIRCLDLSDSTIQMSKIIEYVKNINILELLLYKCDIDDVEGSLIINGLKKSNIRLCLSSNNMTDASALNISKILSKTKIKDLTFNRIGFTYEIVTNDNSFENCFSLNLDDNKFTYNGLQIIIESLANHQELLMKISIPTRISRNPTFRGIEYVPRDLIEIVSNGLRNIPIDFNLHLFNPLYLEINQLLKHCKFHGLKIHPFSEINLSYDNRQILLKGLENSQIKELSLKKCRIDEEGIIELFETLPKTKINNLSINIPKSGGAGDIFVAHSLKRTKVTHLSLKFDDGDNISFAIDAIPWTDIIELNLRNYMNDNGKILLIENLKFTKLIKLSLTDHTISDLDELRLLNQQLPNTKIVSLHLSYDEAADEDDIESELLNILITAVTCKLCSVSIMYRNGAYSDNNLETMKDILENCYLITEFNYKHFYLDLKSDLDNNIEQLINRNKKFVRTAADVIKKFENKSLQFNYSSKNDLSCFQLVVDHYYLWSDIQDSQYIKTRIINEINKNYFQITGIIKKELSCSKKPNDQRKTIADLPIEVLARISSYLFIKDVPK